MAAIGMTLHIGMVGLGRMGGNMAKRLARGGVSVIGFDPDANARAALGAVAGCQSVDTLEEMVHALPPMRVIWLMVPAGHPTEATIAELAPRLHAEDVI